MLNVIKEQDGETLIVRLTGSINEWSDFDQLIGRPPAHLHVYCRNVPRINSEGIKSWVVFFEEAVRRGTELKFFECSTAIVEQLNLISNFSSGGEVVSIFIPFVCQDCKTEHVGLFETKNLRKKKFRLPKLKCPKCGGVVVFDDIQEEYFFFILSKLPQRDSGKKRTSSKQGSSKRGSSKR